MKKGGKRRVRQREGSPSFSLVDRRDLRAKQASNEWLTEWKEKEEEESKRIRQYSFGGSVCECVRF